MDLHKVHFLMVKVDKNKNGQSFYQKISHSEFRKYD